MTLLALRLISSRICFLFIIPMDMKGENQEGPVENTTTGMHDTIIWIQEKKH